MLNATSGIAGLVGSVAGGEVASAWGYPAALGLGAAAVAVGLTVSVLKVAHFSHNGIGASHQTHDPRARLAKGH